MIGGKVLLDNIPDELKEGENWGCLKLDPEWVWLAEVDGKVVGVLIAGNCHGLVFIWRVKVLKKSPQWTLGKLFRKFIRDIRSRGCLGYITFLDLQALSAEPQIARIALRAGAMFTPATTVVFGSVNAKHVGDE